MTISLPPTAPSRQDPATFSDRADAFAAWLVGAVPQFNDLAAGSIDTGNFFNLTVSGQITGNAVTQSSTDSTAGRLLKTRDAGILNDSIGAEEPDDVSTNRIFRGDGAVNDPFSGQFIGWNFSRGSGARRTQLVVDIDSASGHAGYRYYDGSNWTSYRTFLSTLNTTVDSNGFVKEASPIVRLFDDGTQEPVEPVGAHFERLGVGEYRLSGVEPLAETGWQIEVPQDGNGNRLVFVSTGYDPEARALTITTSEPAWDGGWVAGDPKDIPEGRWVDLRFKPLPEWTE